LKSGCSNLHHEHWRQGHTHTQVLRLHNGLCLQVKNKKAYCIFKGANEIIETEFAGIEFFSQLLKAESQCIAHDNNVFEA